MDFYDKENLIRNIEQMTPTQIRQLCARSYEIIYHETEKAAPKKQNEAAKTRKNSY